MRHASEHVPYYRKRFDSLGINLADAVTAEGWRSLPLLTRRNIQEAGTTLHSTPWPCDPKHLQTIATSGSTGEPVVLLRTPRTRLFWRALTVRDHLWHRRDLSGKLAVIRHTRRGHANPPDGIAQESWGSATDGQLRTGPGVMLSVASTITEQAAWVRHHRPSYLLSYPSNLEALARHFIERGERLPNLLEVRTIGEVLTPDQRRICREAWGVGVVDVYTTQEVGYVALQCPRFEHYHVQSENLLVEIISDDGQPCRPGEIGRVLLTSLHNLATPLIRYDVGDFAEVGDACPCGRGLPVLKRIMGRQRNMLALPNGEQTWPVIGQGDDLLELPAFHQVQLVQKSLELIEVRVVAPRTLSPEESNQAKSFLQEMLGHPFEFTFVYVDEIPRGPGGKFEDFRSEVVAGGSSITESS